MTPCRALILPVAYVHLWLPHCYISCTRSPPLLHHAIFPLQSGKPPLPPTYMYGQCGSLSALWYWWCMRFWFQVQAHLAPFIKWMHLGTVAFNVDIYSDLESVAPMWQQLLILEATARSLGSIPKGSMWFASHKIYSATSACHCMLNLVTSVSSSGGG